MEEGGQGEKNRRLNQRKKINREKITRKYHKEEAGRAKQAREKVKQQMGIALPWCGGWGPGRHTVWGL